MVLIMAECRVLITYSLSPLTDPTRDFYPRKSAAGATEYIIPNLRIRELKDAAQTTVK